ncbi:MAG: hypothetical protein AB2810_16810 [Candidatus Thiodiazotropha endolucinida]
MKRAQKRKTDSRKSAVGSTSAKQFKHSKNKSQETELLSNQTTQTVNISEEQLKLITENVTKNILNQLKETLPILSNSNDTEQSEMHQNDSQEEPEVEIMQQGDSTAVSSAIDSVVKDITGTTSVDHTVMPGTAAQLPQPLGLHVDSNVKTKIWANQYIDLSLLLARRASQTYNIQMQNNQLTMVPKQKTFALNMDQWNRAFTIFMAIYVERYPEQATSMLQYMGNMQEMANEAGETTAKYYDSQFRRWRETSQLPWNIINQSLHAKALAVGLKSKANIQAPNTIQRNQKKPCYNFRNTGVCKRANCPFKHYCEHCRTFHNNKICSFRTEQGNSGTSTRYQQQVSRPQPGPSSGPKAVSTAHNRS